jgi:HEPN domain-containing protein
MRFDERQYFRAATERMNQARILYARSDSYAIAMYTAGVAVECMLRAFKRVRTSEFDERHDLLRLFAQSHMLRLNEEVMTNRGATDKLKFAQDLRANVNDVHTLWANDYRYASEGRLKSELTARKLYRGVKGDVLKASAYKLLNAAEKLIERGAEIWTNLVKK